MEHELSKMWTYLFWRLLISRCLEQNVYFLTHKGYQFLRLTVKIQKPTSRRNLNAYLLLFCSIHKNKSYSFSPILNGYIKLSSFYFLGGVFLHSFEIDETEHFQC